MFFYSLDYLSFFKLNCNKQVTKLIDQKSPPQFWYCAQNTVTVTAMYGNTTNQTSKVNLIRHGKQINFHTYYSSPKINY